MRALRRTIASLLLVLFTPAALAATPMRLCVAAGGHKAIEFVLQKDHHCAGESHSVNSVHNGADHQVVAENPACADFPLLTDLRMAKRIEIVAPRTYSDPLPYFLLTDSVGHNVGRNFGLRFTNRTTILRSNSPQQISHRSLVLRI